MLTHETNMRLAQVEGASPMGQLLRRYWQPIAGVTEFKSRNTKPVKVFGEDLVLFRDLNGKFGLIARRCPHRRADLAFGIVEEDGIRCNYHGWKFDAGGVCMHQPFEEISDPEARLRPKCNTRSYAVRENAGMIWAYMGPAPVPELPQWETFGWPHGFKQIIFAEIPCNWLQCQENAIDPVHFEWLHNNWTTRLRGHGDYSPTHTKLQFEEFDHGFVFKRQRSDGDDSTKMWAAGRAMLYPNAFYLGNHFEWRVPIDNGHTSVVIWTFSRVPSEAEPYVQEEIPTWNAKVKTEDGKWITTHLLNQDFMTWVGQGQIVDRTQERLGASDRGITMLRRQLLADLDAIERGEDPKGVIRDPAKNVAIRLPSALREEMMNGLPRAEMARNPHMGPLLDNFPLVAGQPAEVIAQYEAAMGVRMTHDTLVDFHGSRASK
jgi:5,5'-dehydrodivanillate O-demethylase